MSKTSKQLPQVVARGFEIMLNAIPAEALVSGSRAEDALHHYRSRADNHLTSAFSDLLQELNPCIDSNQLPETDVEHALMQVEAALKSWNIQ